MAEATATAGSGLVRTQRRAWTLSRGCWRLVVLLGLAWVALLLLGGTAHAASSDEQPAPPRPAGIPLLGQALAGVGNLTAALPVREVATGLTAGDDAAAQPLATAVESATTAVTDAAAATTHVASAAAAAAPAYLPAADGLDSVGHLADTMKATAEATASGATLLDVKVPSISTLADPLVAGVGEQVDTATELAAGAVAALVAPVPVAHPIAAALAPTVAKAVGTVDVLTDVLTASTSVVTRTADGVVGAATGVLSPVLAVVTAPAGSIVVSAGGTGGASGPAVQPGVPTAVPTTVAGASSLTVAPIRGADATCPDALHRGPAVPPPDAGGHTIHLVAQPAPDTATVLPVPVSGAGSTTGNGGSAPTPVLDQALVRVESEPEFTAESNDPIDGPTGPMPGTPASDPAFSPD